MPGYNVVSQVRMSNSAPKDPASSSDAVRSLTTL